MQVRRACKRCGDALHTISMKNSVSQLPVYYRTVRTVEITNSARYATINGWIDSHNLPERTGSRSDDTWFRDAIL